MESFDCIVVGGGILGAAAAYRLTCKGAGRVLLLERNEFASAASSRAAGLILQATAKPSKTPLAKLTLATLPQLEDELGTALDFRRVGSLRAAASAARAAELAALADEAAQQGIAVDRVRPSEAGDLVPWLDGSAVMDAFFFPDDGYIDPYRLTLAYIKAAEARGAAVRPRTAVREILLAGGKATGVLTADGPIAGGTVVDACGVWAALLSAPAGFPLPLAPVRSHYWITEPEAAYGRAHPMTILPDAGAYTRPEVGGLLLGLQEPRSATFDARDLPDDLQAFSPTAGEEHWDILAAAYDALVRFFPAIESARFRGYIAGLSSYTPDGEIVLGAVPGIAGFYAIAGDCGAGIALSAGMGDAVADLALGRPPAFDLTAFRPARFGEVDPFGPAFRESCAAARAAKTRRRRLSAARGRRSGHGAPRRRRWSR